MSIHIALNHITEYSYDKRINLGPQVVRLRPAPHCRTRILSYALKVEPGQHFINWQQDPAANYLARIVFPEQTESLRIEVDLVAEMAVFNPFDFFLEPQATDYPFTYDETQLSELAPYLVQLSGGARFRDYLGSISRKKRRTIDFLVEINQQLHKDIAYLIRLEPGVQTPDETLQKSSGSCRDSAWLLVQLLRHLGLAARFVSGYLIQLKPDVPSLDGPNGPVEDFTDLHAWCEVYLPGAGWIGLDPTSGLLAGEGHIPLACSPEPSSAAPISGVLDECETTFTHHMQITRIWQAPRVTKPYSDEQWQDILALGDEVDANLDEQDVRLSMGGEPTFVSIDDQEGAEWNTAALGPTKRLLAADLYHRLRTQYGSQGLVHFGQGKWYPGEQLPRWSLNSYWRKDGEPIWQNSDLIADEHTNYNADDILAGRFLRRLAQELRVESDFVFPAYEDVYYYLWREHRLPENVDPFDSRLSDPLERERLMRVFTQGLKKVAGHVLPIARNAVGGWQSGPWFLRSERCYLVPGDSPLGYRLPLDSQPWTSAIDYPWVHEQDPFAKVPPLRPYTEIRQQYQGLPGKFSSAVAEPQFKQSAAWITRTAICAEARNGVLYIFMPPTYALEDYLEVVTAVEKTAEALGTAILLEGYEPPRDPRLNHFRITPDPGVIEVNIHPSNSWRELVDRTTHLYEAARLTRLSTEKFMLDGRHTGTGGGNHFVLGGATPVDSPFLRRPDLLRSLIAYWHNHPSLSYLFSGLFIGPTSQAPRVDEARNDSIYELEIAFGEIDRLCKNQDCPPWRIDRILRNLLIDVTGNTHRAEFCIDKLYSPDGPAGRLGLLELRAFEMPPHARMSLVQQLLLRACITRFWDSPYQPSRLVRWGTELHDRFLLPHFVWQDFCDVMEDFKQAGYAFKAEWFSPHFEFRFPKYGDLAALGMELELRGALEPWHVLGEEGMVGGTVRYVDSSVERLQVKITGMPPDRYVLSCNGHRVPLQSTGQVGEFVAGVRYRAWQPPSCLHPTIGSHAPLTFDVYDTWNQRSVAGCQYHVAHPGGRAYDTYPINAYEAESRRLNRFFRFGHTTANFPLKSTPVTTEFPFTLDLRK